MGILVLIVDDVEDIRYTIKESLKLQDSSYRFLEASSGEECLQIVAKQKPDLILMDIMLPGMDGMDAAIKVKENPDWNDIKIIYLTAKNDSLTKGIGVLSADGFVEKPFDPVMMDKLIKTVMKKDD